MASKIFRTSTVPLRSGLSWDDRWCGNDQGLITCWETGRKLRDTQPSLATLAEAGELPLLPWKGGIDGDPKLKRKVGSLNYLAAWMGLRNEDLRIDLSEEPVVTCTRTGVEVTFTYDTSKLLNG